MNQRFSQRLLVRRAVTFAHPSPVRWSEMLNLGVDGLFLQGSFPFDVGEVIGVSFYLKEVNEWIIGEVEVRWTRTPQKASHFPTGIGVQFRSLSKRGRFLLDQFLNVGNALSLIQRIEKRHQRLNDKTAKDE